MLKKMIKAPAIADNYYTTAFYSKFSMETVVSSMLLVLCGNILPHELSQ